MDKVDEPETVSGKRTRIQRKFANRVSAGNIYSAKERSGEDDDDDDPDGGGDPGGADAGGEAAPESSPLRSLAE